MEKKGHVSDELNAGRLVAHGKIASLTAAFTKAIPFSILVITKAKITGALVAADDNQLLLVSLKLYQDNDGDASLFPVTLNQWTEGAIKEIAATAIDLSVYDVYWATGDYVS